MALLSQGVFFHLSEAALFAGVSAQRVGQWCKVAKLDWRARRKHHVTALWQAELRKSRMRSKGKRPRRRTKAEQRVEVAAKTETFLRKGGTIKR